eukprot:s4226_g2.t1
MFPSQKFWLLLLAAPTMASNDTTNATVNVSTSLQMTTACHAVCDGLSDLQLDLHELRQRHVSGEDVTLLEQCMAARCPSSRSFRKLSARSFPQRHAAVVKCIFQARVACPSLQSLKDGRAEELPKAEEPQQAQSQPAEEPKKAEAKKPEDAKAEEEHDTWSEEKREDYCCCTTLSPLARACSTATSAASQRHQHLQETLRCRRESMQPCSQRSSRDTRRLWWTLQTFADVTASAPDLASSQTSGGQGDKTLPGN